MAIPSEFLEREYESLFIQELSKLGSFTWTPGQTDESVSYTHLTLPTKA